MNRISIFLAMIMFSISYSVVADKPEDSVYLDGGESKSALILAHGKGKHPTWLVVDPLRKGVSDKLGFHTLSLQMPTGNDDWKDYAYDFPDAYKTIKEAIRFLKEEKGVTKVFLMGHSMGSRMASAFVADNPTQPLSGLIVAGCRNNGGTPLSCIKSLQKVEIAVLDIWGGDNLKDSKSAAKRSDMVSDKYTQVSIDDGNHKFEGYESEFVQAVVDWLKNH